MKNSVFQLKVVLFTAGVLFSNQNAKAQKGLQIGFEANPQLSYLYNQDDQDSKLFKDKSAFNGHFGFSGQYGFTEKMGVGVNILYSFQGDKYDWKNVERLKSLQYFKIPVMFTLSIPYGEHMMFVGKIGPQISILTDSRLYASNKDIIKTNYSEPFTKYDFGGMISAGIAHKVNDNLTIDAAIRFDSGFTNVEDEDYKLNIHNPYDFTTPSPASSPRASTYNMTAGLTFGLRYCFQ